MDPLEVLQLRTSPDQETITNLERNHIGVLSFDFDSSWLPTEAHRTCLRAHFNSWRIVTLDGRIKQKGLTYGNGAQCIEPLPQGPHATP